MRVKKEFPVGARVWGRGWGAGFVVGHVKGYKLLIKFDEYPDNKVIERNPNFIYEVWDESRHGSVK